MDENLTNSFELCTGCVDKDLDVPDEDFSHKTSHSFFKSLRTLTFRETPTVNRLAKRAIGTASERFSKPDTGSPPRCLACGQQVSRPCWYCAECTDVEVFLCNVCEAKQLELSAKGPAANDPAPHHWWHVLVKVHDVEKQADPGPQHNELQTRLAALEQRFAAHEAAMNARLEVIEHRLGVQVNPVEQIENMLGARMTTLEGLLWRLIQKG
ncbi:hypothetical protein AURDEDRAFT_162402 [Auricularia subglabra TFB-10046 SS5]|nr:hypothetical protein AURDEDRAFT_162402 [Auricularia subglabra TFB-10046 SS5]